MNFRRIIFSAALIGLLAGLLNSGVQMLDVTAIIFQAETYEVADVDAASMGGHSHGHDHEHSAAAWAPEDGAERTMYTFIANILSAIGFAAILLALMNQCQQQGMTQLSSAKGVLWGLAGFLSFFVMPGLGLSPEIPGMQAAALESRQLWWALTVLSSVLGLALLAFSPLPLKALGLFSLIIPHMLGAPHLDGPEFSHPDPSVVETLHNLHQQFIVATGISNLIFWLVLGVACAWAIKHAPTVADRNG